MGLPFLRQTVGFKIMTGTASYRHNFATKAEAGSGLRPTSQLKQGLEVGSLNMKPFAPSTPGMFQLRAQRGLGARPSKPSFGGPGAQGIPRAQGGSGWRVRVIACSVFP